MVIGYLMISHTIARRHASHVEQKIRKIWNETKEKHREYIRIEQWGKSTRQKKKHKTLNRNVSEGKE